MAFWQDKIYPKLPVFAQNLAVSAYGYKWKQRRFGGIFEQELYGFKNREQFSEQEWRDYQTVQLRKLLLYAFETVPFYRERYGALGFTESQFKCFEIEDLPKLPFLTKDDLRHFGTTTLLSSRREKKGQFFNSSGSTGTPVSICYSEAFHQRVNAAYECRVRNWAGVNKELPRGMIGGRKVVYDTIGSPPFYRFNYFEKQTYFSSYHISLENAPDYLKGMRQNDVNYMVGQATSNYLLAKFFDCLQLEAPELKAVITTSEKLHPNMRETLSNVYKCRVFDSYSGVENCGLISESPGGVLFVSPDVGILEVLNGSGQMVNSGEEGDVVCTGFLNFDQPLIRYRIGDRVRTSLCSRSTSFDMPAIDEISGRIEDVIQTKDGRHMVRFDKIFIMLPSVIEAQIIQYDLDNYTIKVLADKCLPKKEEIMLTKRLKDQLGKDVNLSIQEVDNIERGPNGKFKAVISHVKRAESVINLPKY